MTDDWCWAGEWRGRVTLDGVDVSHRCAGIQFEGERPVAVALYWLEELGDARSSIRVFNGELVRHVRQGEIAAVLTKGQGDLWLAREGARNQRKSSGVSVDSGVTDVAVGLSVGSTPAASTTEPARWGCER